MTGFYTESESNSWIVYGPAEDGEEGPGAFYHESFHKLINPVVYKNTGINGALKDLLPLAQEKLNGDHNELNELISESFVRAIDCYLTNEYYNKSDKNKLFEIIEDEYRQGHILCFSIMENIPGYLSSKQSDGQFKSKNQRTLVSYI